MNRFIQSESDIFWCICCAHRIYLSSTKDFKCDKIFLLPYFIGSGSNGASLERSRENSHTECYTADKNVYTIHAEPTDTS